MREVVLRGRDDPDAAELRLREPPAPAALDRDPPLALARDPLEPVRFDEPDEAADEERAPVARRLDALPDVVRLLEDAELERLPAADDEPELAAPSDFSLRFLGCGIFPPR